MSKLERPICQAHTFGMAQPEVPFNSVKLNPVSNSIVPVSPIKIHMIPWEFNKNV